MLAGLLLRSLNVSQPECVLVPALLDCDIGLFQDQYVFLYHALLDGLQTGHLAYPVSQFQSLYKILCEDDVNLTQLREQFQVRHFGRHFAIIGIILSN